MMELSSGLETGVVGTGLVAMLSMAVWLVFRRETNGEKSLFSKMISPYDDEIKKRTSHSLFFPSTKEEFLKDPRKNHAQGFEALNQRMGMIPFARSKETSMKSQSASTIDLQKTMNAVQSEPDRQSSGGHWQKSAGMFAGQRSLGGILVVDDDPAIRRLIRLILEHSGYDVLVAEDGEDAINLLRSGENLMVVDTIITDLTMPKMNGVKAIAYFQKAFPSIPLIILTGIADVELAVSFMRQGVSNYLVKPIDMKQLKTSVAHAIEQRQLSWA